MLRPLFRKFSSSYGSGGRFNTTGASGHNNIGLVTIGGTGARSKHMKLSDGEPDMVNGDCDLHSSEDGESTRRILQVHVTHEVTQETAKGDKGRDGVQFQVAVGSPRHGSGLRSAQYN